MSMTVDEFVQARVLVVISPTKKGITFAFSRGAEFEDRHGLLEGVGKVSKNVRIRDLKSMDRVALRDCIQQALEFDASTRSGPGHPAALTFAASRMSVRGTPIHPATGSRRPAIASGDPWHRDSSSA
jgi:hypothetical protein